MLRQLGHKRLRRLVPGLAEEAAGRRLPLRTPFERAGLKAGVADIGFEAADGDTDSLPLHKALAPTTLLAWERNGEPLPPDHGHAVRIIVPGIYSMKNVKWLAATEAVTYDHRATGSDGAGGATAAGTAFAGGRGIFAIAAVQDATRRRALPDTGPPAITGSLSCGEGEGAIMGCPTLGQGGLVAWYSLRGCTGPLSSRRRIFWARYRWATSCPDAWVGSTSGATAAVTWEPPM
ncbi:MAG: molybdopterin-dependent oxidoreductase [Bacillota bacterium]